MGVPSSSRISNSLVALGSAAVLAVYTAGYVRTRAAAARFSDDVVPRRVAVPIQAPAGAGVAAPLAMPRETPAPNNAAAALVTPPATSGPIQTAKSGAVVESPSVQAAVIAPAVPAPSASLEPAPVASVPANAAPASPVSASVVEAPVAPKATESNLAPAPPARGQWKDGTFYGWGTSRHGDIQAAVVIEKGHIAGVWVTQCLTRYSCSWIAHLPAQVLSRQSPECDYVSGATQSTNAFYYAVVEALGKAK